MASKALSLFFSLLLFIIHAHGRTLQTNDTGKSVNVSHTFSFATTYKGKTNYSDVLGLYAWISQTTWLEEANPDPCLPPKWTWIECNSNPSSRVIALDLSSRGVMGILPDFSSMDALQTIDVSINMLSGSIPLFLGQFPHLKQLNLTGNGFSGLIPDSLACNKDLNIIVETYTDLRVSDKCAGLWTKAPSPPANTNTDTTSSSTPAKAGGSRTTIKKSKTKTKTKTKKNKKKKNKKKKVAIILGTCIPLFFILCIAFGIFMVYRHKKTKVAAIARASKQGPSDTKDKDNIPVDERPMNNLPNNSSSHNT